MSLFIDCQNIDLSQNCAETNQFDERIRAPLLQRIEFALERCRLVFLNCLRNFLQSFSCLTFLIHRRSSHITHICITGHIRRVLTISDELIRVYHLLMGVCYCMHGCWGLHIETSNEITIKFINFDRSLQSLLEFLLGYLPLIHVKRGNLLQKATYGLVLHLLKHFLLKLRNLNFLVEETANFTMWYRLCLWNTAILLDLASIWARNFLEKCLKLIFSQN